MKAKKSKITPSELAEQQQANRERNRLIEQRGARLREEEKPLLDELHKAGYPVSALWHLAYEKHKYLDAIPILLKHLMLPYSDPIRDGIARRLAIPEARPAWPILVAEYRKAPIGFEDGFRLRAKSGLAVALSATVTNETIEELIALAKDPANGSSRLLLLHGLLKSKTLAAKQALEELAFDPELAKELAIRLKGRKKTIQ